MPGVLAEPDVDQRDVRGMALDQLAAFAGGARGADDLEALAAEQQLESFAQGLVIFDEYERKGQRMAAPTLRKLARATRVGRARAFRRAL